MTTASGTTTTTNDVLRDLLQRIRDDPDAGAWAEWARRLMEGDAQRKHKAIEAAKRGTTTAKGLKKRLRLHPQVSDSENRKVKQAVVVARFVRESGESSDATR